MKKLKFIALALCAIIFAACSSPSKSDSPQVIVKEYLDLIKAEKFDKAVKCFYFKDEVKESELNALAAKMQAGYKEKSGIDKYEIISEEIEKDENDNAVSGKVLAKVFYKDGNVEEENISAIKIDGEWKIDFSIK